MRPATIEVGSNVPAAPHAWAHLGFFARDWPGIAAAIAADAREVLPPPADRFRALELTPPDAVRVVILGQDPYPTPGHAHGLAFSVPDGTALPRSLANIFREMRDDIGTVPTSGKLEHWARQGVLLLNTALTVPAGDAGGHARLGWERLAAEVLADIAARRPTAFLLWGAHAAKMAAGLPTDGHLFIATAHPSPLSARRGFFGSRPFSRINAWLAQRGEPPIDWAGAGDASLRGNGGLTDGP